MKKITIVLSTSLIALSIFLFFFLKSKDNQPSSEIGSASDQNISSNVFSGSTNSPLSFNTEKENGKTFLEYAEESPDNLTNSRGIKEIEIKNSQKIKVSLLDFFKLTQSEMPKEIENFANNHDYTVFYCPKKNEKGKDFGLVINVKKISSTTLNEKDVYADVVKRMKNWEPTMFKSLSGILFPNFSFSASELSTSLQFGDGKNRFSEISLPERGRLSLNYKIYGDPIIISSSPDCLETAFKKIVDTAGGY